jgi:hypothetical protein
MTAAAVALVLGAAAESTDRRFSDGSGCAGRAGERC